MKKTERSGQFVLHRTVILLCLSLISTLHILPASGAGPGQGPEADTVNMSVFPVRRYVGALSFEARTGGFMTRNSFFSGENLSGKPIRYFYAAHLRYSFAANRNTWEDLLYGAPYQGLGFAMFKFNNNAELGSPSAVYILQGGRLARLSPRFSLLYEWNLGFSFGWTPYNFFKNYYNTAIGSRVNVYLGLSLYVNWIVSRKVDLSLSASFNHFSNGNTQPPNRGVNLLSGGLNIKYNFGRTWREEYKQQFEIAKPKGHMVYELYAYHTQKSTTLDTTNTNILNPYTDTKFSIFGLGFAPLYQIDYKVRVGAELDFHYNQSAGVTYHYEPHTGMIHFTKAPMRKQLFMGIAGRVDYIMPFFTVSLNIGYNVIHNRTTYNPFYQSIALKVNVTEGIFLNMGYRISNFKYPNFLMFGVGYRFNNHEAKHRPVSIAYR